MNIEEIVQDDLTRYLRNLGEIGGKMPETDDICEKWEQISKAYIPDGIREFSEYPTVSLGWMMYTGMAVATFWEEDWESWHNRDDIYIRSYAPPEASTVWMNISVRRYWTLKAKSTTDLS